MEEKQEMKDYPDIGLYSPWDHSSSQSPYHGLAQKLINLTGYRGCNHFSPDVLEKIDLSFRIAAEHNLEFPNDFCLLAASKVGGEERVLIGKKIEESASNIQGYLLKRSREKTIQEYRQQLLQTLSHITYIAALEQREVSRCDFIVSMCVRSTQGCAYFCKRTRDRAGNQKSNLYFAAMFINGEGKKYDKLIEDLSSTSAEFKRYMLELHKGNGGLKTSSSGSKVEPDQVWQALNSEFPWMREVNLFFVRNLATLQSGKAKWIRPILLLGDSGIGKTQWCIRVAQLLEQPQTLISAGGGMSGAAISGFERTWKNSEPSIVAKALENTDGSVSIILDEIDKAATNTSGGVLTEALLPLLNLETAQQYRDLHSGKVLDASRITWMFTANSLASLGSPFLDRVRTFHVDRPRKHEIEALFNRLQQLGDTNWQENREEDLVAMHAAYGERGSIRAAKEALEEQRAIREWSPPEDLDQGPKLRLV